MTAPWFFAPEEDWTDSSVLLPADESHHAHNVLRVAPPDVITVTDGAGRVGRCSVRGIDSTGRVVAELLHVEAPRRARPEVVVYHGAAKGAKNDDVLERLAELGVAEVWVFESTRSVVHWDGAKRARLAERWRAIARSAAKQSRTPWTSITGSPLSWTELVRRVAREPMSVILWEEASLPLRTALTEPADRLALVVGPEGGLARSEAEALADAGGQLVSLGPRILRTENAPVVATAALLYHYGVIG